MRDFSRASFSHSSNRPKGSCSGRSGRGSAAVAASGLFANATTIVVAILSSNDELEKGLVDAAGYGLLGVLLIGVVFKVVDWLTPGDLGAMVAHDDHHPAVWITVVSHIAVGAIVAASIS